MYIVILCLIICVIGINIIGIFWISRQKPKQETELPAERINQLFNIVTKVAGDVDILFASTKATDDIIKTLPSKVLATLKGATNSLQGDLGEHIQLLKLKADYDILIPLGSIVDYIGIKFPNENNEGTLDFIEVKTNNSRLSSSQKKLQDLVVRRKIGFKQVTVKIDDIQGVTKC